MIGRLGVCTWSLRPNSAASLAELSRQTGAEAVQISLEPMRQGLCDGHQTVEALRRAGLELCSGMFEPAGEDYTSLASIRRTGGLVPDARWEENLTRARQCAAIAERIGLDLVTFHAGFMPHERSDPARGVLLDRLREVVDVFAGLGVSLALETGQERAEDLAGFLEDLGRESVGVNFDPANMILYGMGDPLASLRRLAPRVVQVHLKDAVSCPEPGRWGREVRLGAGEVVWDALLLEIRSWPRRVNLLVERESGEERVSDAAAGLELVRAVVRQWEPAGV